ncbi:MAG: glycosyltransferase [Flavobacteriales bacterium]
MKPIAMSTATPPPAVLIICRHFPPANDTGARRPYFLARALQASGHRVSIMTGRHNGTPWNADISGFTVMRFEPSQVQGDLSRIQRLLARLDRSAANGPLRGPFRFLADMTLPVNHSTRWNVDGDLVERELGRPDIIVATGPPWDVLETGHALAERFGATFIVDERDPWNAVIDGVYLKCLNWHGKGITGALRAARMRRTEERILRNADGMTAASPAYLENALHMAPRTPARVVLNGILPVEPAPYDAPNEKFTMIYTGRIYEEQDWGAILRALDHILEEYPGTAADIVLELWGSVTDRPDILGSLHEWGARTGMLVARPMMDRDRLAAIGQRADLLLSVICEGNSGQIPLKLMDYMAWGRPILLVGRTKGIQHELIANTRTGSSAATTGELVRQILEAHGRWRAGTTITDRPGPEMMAELRLDEQMSSWKEFILECHARAKRSRT